MDLPKIKNENLPDELKKLLGDADAEFDSIVDPSDVLIDVQYDLSAFYEQKAENARRFVEARKKLNKMRTEQRLTESEDSASINTDS
jgi:hypothetical protein